jgi:predicted RNA-binding Zn ribbon-like protein
MSLPFHLTLNATPAQTTCLDFANTLSWRGTATPAEGLPTFEALLEWIAGPLGLSMEQVGQLRDWAARQPEDAAALFADAIALRELAYRMFHAVAAGNRVAEADLAALNRALATIPPRTRLARLGDAHAWRIDMDALTASTLLAPVLWSVGDLLVQAPRHRIRHCANPECLWLFVDESKNGTRRWCDMAACGNRAKARRHYLRARAT